jgi:hypothetical protein
LLCHTRIVASPPFDTIRKSTSFSWAHYWS